MAKPPFIELGFGRNAERIPILYEDRAVIAVDKPRGWMLVPFTWQRTTRNLQAAIQSALGAGAHWARSRNLRFLRHVHRLDGDTSGVLLLGKTPGAVRSLGDLFETRRMEKKYLAVVWGVPAAAEWSSQLPIGKDPSRPGRMSVDPKNGKDADTAFRLLATSEGRSLIEAHPTTGRTHQIRVHLAAAGLPVLGDALYGRGDLDKSALGLRAIELAYNDPFNRHRVHISAPRASFMAEFGFASQPAVV